MAIESFTAYVSGDSREEMEAAAKAAAVEFFGPGYSLKITDFGASSQVTPSEVLAPAARQRMQGCLERAKKYRGSVTFKGIPDPLRKYRDLRDGPQRA